MKIANTGLKLIKSFEGLELTAYHDIANVPTIGYGHTKTVTHLDVTRKKTITKAEADELLQEDLSLFVSGVNNLTKKISLNQNQFDALVSLAFNIGLGALGRSTVLKKLKKSKYLKAAEAILMWDKATVNGKLRVSRGLARRRAAEKELFLRPTTAIKGHRNTARVTACERGGLLSRLNRALLSPGGKLV